MFSKLVHNKFWRSQRDINRKQKGKIATCEKETKFWSIFSIWITGCKNPVVSSLRTGNQRNPQRWVIIYFVLIFEHFLKILLPDWINKKFQLIKFFLTSSSKRYWDFGDFFEWIWIYYFSISFERIVSWVKRISIIEFRNHIWSEYWGNSNNPKFFKFKRNEFKVQRE